VEDVVIDLKNFNVVQNIGNKFQYREVAHSYNYKNTALYNLMVESLSGEIIRIGSPFYQNKNFNEWFSVPKLEFIPYDSTSVFKDICKKQKAFLSALADDFNYRWCTDISEVELAKFTFFDLSGKKLTQITPEDLGGFTNLKYLQLINNKITSFDDATLNRMQSLETLDITLNPIPSAELGKIRKALPSTNVLFNY